MSAIFHSLLPGVCVIERGWLNCNQVVLTSPDRNVLIDSGYGRHAEHTLRWVDQALSGGHLDWLINTHCHSDHMGGNRALRERYACRVTIPAGEVPNVVPWTAQSCWSGQMDQYAEAFAFDDTLQPGDEFVAGGYVWQALAAPGHDMDALIFFAPVAGIVVTGDALWEKGLGFVWPGSDAGTARNPHISAALATLDQIESLSPRWVVPGHGAPFTNVAAALGDARSKLKAFANDPAKNARHVAKIMFVFALLDKQSMPVSEVPRYFSVVPVYRQLAEEYLGLTHDALAEKVLGELHHVGAISVANDVVYPTMRA